MRHWILAFAVLTGCFKPTFNNSACGPNGECPDGFDCILEVCVQRDMPDDGRLPDDVLVEPGESYQEASNEGVDEINSVDNPENANLVITPDGGRKFIFGTLVNRTPNAQLDDRIDSDSYTITTSGASLVGFYARITSPGAGDFRAVTIGTPDQLNGLFEDAAEVTVAGKPGSIVLTVQSFNATALGRAVAYTIELVPITSAQICGIAAGAATKAEALDSAGNVNRGNDIGQGLRNSITATAATTDAPEVVPGLPLTPGQRVKVSGSAANTALTVYNDEYRDRDAFRIVAGDGTRRLSFHLVWTDAAGIDDDADLDYFVTDENFGARHVGGSEGFGGFEYNSATDVVPGTVYFVMVASYETSRAAKSYELEICADAE
jgi:hypothetical protein